jgi:hypothetical protein
MSAKDNKGRQERAERLHREIEEAVGPGEGRSPRSPREFVEERMRKFRTRRGKKPGEPDKGEREP